MYRIAICDNDAAQLSKIATCVQRYLQDRRDINGVIETFISSAELAERITEHGVIPYDVFLLDILMPDVNGISLGRCIREKSNDVPIIYVSSTKDFAFEAYGVNAIQYLTKPLDPDRLAEVMDRIYEAHCNRPKHIVALKSIDGVIQIAMEEIMYVENRGRIATYSVTNGGGTRIICPHASETFEQSVGEIMDSKDFVQPHKSYFANLKYVKVFKNDSLTMDDDAAIPINQKRLAAVRKSYLSYMSRLMGE